MVTISQNGATIRTDLQAPVIVTGRDVILADTAAILPVPMDGPMQLAALDVKAPGFRYSGNNVDGQNCLYSIQQRWANSWGNAYSTELAVFDHVTVSGSKDGAVVQYSILEGFGVEETKSDGVKIHPGANVLWNGGGGRRIGYTPGGDPNTGDPQKRKHADLIQIDGMAAGSKAEFKRLLLINPHPLSPAGNVEYASNSCVFLETSRAPIRDVLFEECEFDGGTYTIYCLQQEPAFGPPANVAFVDCLFGRNYAFGLLSATRPRTIRFENPRWSDTLEPVLELLALSAGDRT